MMEVYEDETKCGPLCQHPACWQSTNRKVKNIPHKAFRSPSPEDIELDLPTLKVRNMLEDYGEDERDLYPVEYGGRPLHARNASKSLQNVQNPTRKSSIKQTNAPVTSPASPDTKNRRQEELNKKLLKYVEVQEVFDLEDLNSTWDDTFIAKQYYVWVPKKRAKKDKLKPIESASISQMYKAGPKKVLVRDMTEDMIPRTLEYDRHLNSRSPECGAGPIIKKKRAVMSPCSSRMRRTPYSQFSTSNRGYLSAHSSKRLVIDSDSIDELLDLPRDVLMQVLDHTRQSDFTSREKIHEIIQKFLPPYDRMYTYESAASSDLLQQRKVQLHESKTRNIRQSHLMETKPVFYLDDEGVENEEDQVPPPPVTQRFDSDYGSIRDLYMTGTRDFTRFRRPLPAIGDRMDIGFQKLPSISLGLPELPRGMKHTRTFTYNKKNYNKIDFSLGPVPTPPTSSRESVEPPVVHGSDHGTTVNANVPSPSSPRQQLVGVPMSVEERKALENASATQSQRSTPLHAVSPSTSTKVPLAPASTPAIQQSPQKAVPAPVEVPSGEMLARTNTGTSSPTQNIRAPVNSPRDASPDRERTGLGTIEEKHSEEDNVQAARGRNVRFATGDVPEVPPPPSSPQEEGDGETVEASEMSTAAPTTKPGSTVATNINTMNTRDPTLTEAEMVLPVETKRESTMASTPEPWPSVNEADFDITPASTKLALHSESVMKNKRTPVNSDSRQAHLDPQSDRAISMQTGKMTMRSDDVSQASSLSTKKQLDDGGKAESPGPPPPSPEPKDINKNSQEEPKSNRRRDLKSRESATMEPLIEEHEENDPNQVKTIVVSVPPLGNQGKPRPKNYRTIDTFVSIDIPAVSPDSSAAKSEDAGKQTKLEPHAEEISETDDPETRTINTREQVLSQVSTIGERTVDGQDSMSDVTSAGVAPSLGGNVSPTSTVTGGAKGPNIDLKLFMEEQDKEEGGSSANGKIIEEEGDKNDATKQDIQVPDITEEGGDHEGFKQELKEEFDRISGEGKDDTPENGQTGGV